MVVAVAEPAMPSAGIGPRPRMKTGLSVLSSTTLKAMNQNGVSESPAPRSPIISSTSMKPAGMERKITRR